MEASPDKWTLYATALDALALAADASARVEADLQATLEALRAHPDIPRFLRDPAVMPEGKERALRELFDGKVHPVLLHMLVLLAVTERWPDVPALADRYFERAATRREEAPGELVSAIALPEEKVRRIEQELSHQLGRRVHLRPRIDRSLLGGFVARVGNYVFDGSVDRQLEEIHAALLRPPAPDDG